MRLLFLGISWIKRRLLCFYYCVNQIFKKLCIAEGHKISRQIFVASSRGYLRYIISLSNFTIFWFTGLGYHESKDERQRRNHIGFSDPGFRPYNPDHDMEIRFDATIDNEDLANINWIRFYINAALRYHSYIT